MDKESIYTSTGIKLLNHPAVLAKFKETGVATPVSLQIAPTSECNLNCVFCSNAKRKKKERLGFDLLMNVIDRLKLQGLKTVEWTGGGDPTLYPEINEAIAGAKDLYLKQGFITNGLLLGTKLSQTSLESLSWLRVSMNCLDYYEEVQIPEIGGTLGFSYVMNQKTTPDSLARLRQHVAKYKPEYVRIVPNCQATFEEQEYNNKQLAIEVALWGLPYFFQAKRFRKPEFCWWGYFKPFLLHDGYVYPCSSVVLNDDAERSFHVKYRWVKAEDLWRQYTKKAIPWENDSCAHCVFRVQNDAVNSLVAQNGMEDFV